MKIKTIILALLPVALICSCGNGSSGGGSASSVREEAVSQVFPSVTVPGIISSDRARIDYLAEHFWDGFDSFQGGHCDSVTIKGISKKEFSRQFVLWCGLLKNASPEAMGKGVENMFTKAQADAMRDSTSNFFEMAVDAAESYLYDPVSPVRNEEAYLLLLRQLLSSSLVDPDHLPAYAFAADICALNRPGTPAADFAFVTPQGDTRTLYGVEAPLVLLFFSNPGCPMCAEYQEKLSSNLILADHIDDGNIAVVNIYPDGDVAAWEEYVNTYPSSWICGRDPSGTLRTDLIYGLRAIPSLYVLGEDKTVLGKDVSIEEAESILMKEIIKIAENHEDRK